MNEEYIDCPARLIEMSQGRKILAIKLNPDVFCFEFTNSLGEKSNITLSREAVWGMQMAVESLDDANRIKASIHLESANRCET